MPGQPILLARLVTKGRPGTGSVEPSPRAYSRRRTALVRRRPSDRDHRRPRTEGGPGRGRVEPALGEGEIDQRHERDRSGQDRRAGTRPQPTQRSPPGRPRRPSAAHPMRAPRHRSQHLTVAQSPGSMSAEPQSPPSPDHRTAPSAARRPRGTTRAPAASMRRSRPRRARQPSNPRPARARCRRPPAPCLGRVAQRAQRRHERDQGA